MKISRILIAVFITLTLLFSCNKSHYDVGNVHGVNAEGEMLLPLVTGNYSLKHLMERFQLDTLISCDASGNLFYVYNYEYFGAVNGEDLLHFKDWNYEEQLSFVNPFYGQIWQPIDTVVTMSQTITFEADHISVISALMKSGHFEFGLESNVGDFDKVLVTSSNIKDAEGHDLRFVYQPEMGQTGFDLAGMQYQSAIPNALDLNYEFRVVLNELVAPEIEIKAFVSATDLAIREMDGYVEAYDTRNRVDTTFILFLSNVSVGLEINDALITLHECNDFDLAGRLVVDTAMVGGDGIAPYDLFSPLPLIVDLPASPTFSQVFSQTINGRINSNLGSLLLSSLFTINPDSLNDLVRVTDTCNIDLRVDVNFPFSFKVNEVCYQDTVDMKLSEIEDADLLEKLTLELTFTSTLPLDLSGNFMLYDSKDERVTVVLFENATLIPASYDGHAASTTVEVEITGDDLQKAVQSDQFILSFDLDTDAHNVVLNADQSLQFLAKAKVKYNGTIEY